MGAFGWSLPAGCGSLPGEEEPYIFPEQEAVMSALDDGGVDSAVSDKVDEIVRQLCEDLANARAALFCAAKEQLTVRIDGQELSCTSGHFVELPSHTPHDVARAFVQLIMAAHEHQTQPHQERPSP